MWLSVESAIYGELPHKERLARIKAAGFDAVDFSFLALSGDLGEVVGENYIEVARGLRAYLDGIALPVCQAHAPFEMREGDAFSPECEKYQRLTRSILAAGIIGSPSIVVHSIMTARREDFVPYNREFYLSLLPFAREAGVKIAVENLFCGGEDGLLRDRLGGAREYMDFVRSLGTEHFTFCLDIGHVAVTGRLPEDEIRALDPELFTLMHLHDNDGISDLHAIPFSSGLNLGAITSALAEIGYKGALSLELIGHFNRLPTNELRDSALRHAHDVGRELIRMCGL